MEEYRLSARTIWSIRITAALAAAMWFGIFSVLLAIPAWILLRIASRTDGLAALSSGIVGVVLALAYAVALLWWASTWGRLALAPWGGIGAFFGAFMAVLVIPILIWAGSDIAYGVGLWPVGAVLRIVAWLWALASLIGVWRWIKTGYVGDPRDGGASQESEPSTDLRTQGRKSEMPWFSRSGLSGAEKESARKLIRHLQKMYAYQQLSMERFNDAFAFAAGMGTPTDEGLARPRGLVSDPVAVREHVLPALQEKIQILAEMDAQHVAFGTPSATTLRQVYDDFTQMLAIGRQRALEQYGGFGAWSEDPSLDIEPSVSQSDSADIAAMTQSAASLNGLIAKVGMSQDAWLDLNCGVFNEVRKSIGLPPITIVDFRRRYLGGMMGRPARFFRD